jgi:hypothetical protein
MPSPYLRPLRTPSLTPTWVFDPSDPHFGGWVVGSGELHSVLGKVPYKFSSRGTFWKTPHNPPLPTTQSLLPVRHLRDLWSQVQFWVAAWTIMKNEPNRQDDPHRSRFICPRSP